MRAAPLVAAVLAGTTVLTAGCSASTSGDAAGPEPGGTNAPAVTASVRSPAGTAGAQAATETPAPAPGASSPAVDPSAPAPAPTPTPTAVRGDIDTDRAMEVMRALAAGIGPRAAGTTADRQARALVASALRAAGWEVATEAFPLPQGGESANLVATAPAGDDGAAGPHIVVGAHLDTVPGSPGANDNGTGVGVLVAAAEELADEAAGLPVPVVLVAFGAEEYQGDTGVHHVGSEAYAAARGDGVAGMVSVDMVGNGPATCVCWFDAGPPAMAERVRAAAAAAGIDAVAVERRGDISDHGPFARRGIPAAFLWSYFEPAHHTPEDTADRVVAGDVRRAGRLVLALVRSLGPADRDGVRPAPSP